MPTEKLTPAKLRKSLLNMDKNSIVDILCNLYAIDKYAKDFIEARIEPESSNVGLLEKYKVKLEKTLLGDKIDTKSARIILKEFEKLGVDKSAAAELHILCAFICAEMINDFGYTSDNFLNFTSKTIENAVYLTREIKDNTSLIAKLQKVFDVAMEIEYGMGDYMVDIYYNCGLFDVDDEESFKN